jgi:hypothetical protein
MNANGMNWIRQEKRLAIYLRDGCACIYCGSSIEEGAQLTLDHIVPRSENGGNSEKNLITSCRKCNDSRSNRDIGAFAAKVAGYVNSGLAGEDIVGGIFATVSKPLDMAEAKKLIARRGSAAKAIAKRTAGRQIKRRS